MIHMTSLVETCCCTFDYNGLGEWVTWRLYVYNLDADADVSLLQWILKLIMVQNRDIYHGSLSDDFSVQNPHSLRILKETTLRPLNMSKPLTF